MNILQQIKAKNADRPFIYGWSIIVAIVFLIIGFVFDIVGIAILFSLLFYLLIGLAVHTIRATEVNLKFQQQKNQSILSIHNTLKPDLPLPSMTGWAAEPELIETILKEIAFNKPSVIFEIGSGTSTILSAMMLNKLDHGRIISIDHDERYYDSNQDSINKYGVGDRVTLYHAPLVNQTIGNRSYKWYDLSNVNIDAKIDLVVIDGPPEKTNSMARYPAVPLLYEHLSENAVIILDDASRKDETAAVEEWVKAYPDLKAIFVNSEKGIRILKRG